MPSDYIIRFGSSKLQLLKGDITQIAVDAMVNAANAQLAGGGGVDGAIHNAGGREIMDELDQIRGRQGGCKTGDAVVTRAGKLPAQFIFHAVGPIYRDGQSGEPQALQSCYAKCLQLAAERNLKSISFPSISTGIYRYPTEDAAAIAVTTVARWLETLASPIETVKLVQFSDADHAVYREQATRLRHQAASG